MAHLKQIGGDGACAGSTTLSVEGTIFTFLTSKKKGMV
jgi:hypothetical protein